MHRSNHPMRRFRANCVARPNYRQHPRQHENQQMSLHFQRIVVFGIWSLKLEVWRLEFGVCLDLGAWNLELLWSLVFGAWRFLSFGVWSLISSNVNPFIIHLPH